MPDLIIPWSHLTEIQQSIIEEATTNSNSFFIEGPPGSGKTCISLYIVKNLIGHEVVRPLVLIYNNSLLGYLKSSFEQLGLTDAVTINTKDKFFWSLRKQYGISIDGIVSFEEMRIKILKELIDMNISLEYSIVILDEIQDFTELEWTFLKTLSKRFVFLGDFEQRIYNADLEKKSLLQISTHKLLGKIFRFGEYIAKWVQRFSKNNQILVSKVDKIDTIKPILIDCADPNAENQEIIELIKGRRYDGGRIAVISINKDRLEEIHNYLDSKGVEHLHAPDPKDFAAYDFSSNTPVLITSASAKGLEFSSVIVVGFDKGSKAVWGFKTYGGFEENIYVCLSRATNHLFVLRNPNTVDELQQLEPFSEDLSDEGDWFN